MPWEVKKQGRFFLVCKKGSGKVVGTHDTRDKATRQVQALYANEASKR